MRMNGSRKPSLVAIGDTPLQVVGLAITTTTKPGRQPCKGAQIQTLSLG